MKLRHIFGKTYNILRVRRKLISKLPGHDEGKIKILMFHDVPESSFKQFSNYLKSLYDSYSFLTPDEFHAFINGRNNINGLQLLITFDDAFLSSKVAAKEILGPLGIKAIFFIATNFVGLSDEHEWKKFVSKNFFNSNKPVQEIDQEFTPMSWDDLLWLRNHGHTIGSHTLNHLRLTSLSEDELKSEIIESGDILARELNITIDDFAYPFGDIDSINLSAMAVIRQRYKYCFSGIRGLNKSSTHPLSILRDVVSLNDTTDYVKFIVEDGLSALYQNKSNAFQAIIKDSL